MFPCTLHITHTNTQSHTHTHIYIYIYIYIYKQRKVYSLKSCGSLKYMCNICLSSSLSNDIFSHYIHRVTGKGVVASSISVATIIKGDFDYGHPT